MVPSCGNNLSRGCILVAIPEKDHIDNTLDHPCIPNAIPRHCDRILSNLDSTTNT